MSVYQQQKQTKPAISEIIPATLSGDKERLAHEFTAYLRSLKMQPIWASADSWKCSYKGKGVCYVRLREGYLSVSPYVDYTPEFEAFAIKEGLQERIWENLPFCRRCNPKGCASRCHESVDTFRGVKRTFMGREFDHVCVGGGDAHFHDPDEADLGCIKKLIEYRRQSIDGNQVQKVKYMAIKKRIDKTEVIDIKEDIKVMGLSLEKAGWAKRADMIGTLWGVYTDAHRMKANAKLPVVGYGFWFDKSGDYDYIVGSEVVDFCDTGDEQIGFTIPAGRYIKDSFNAFDFEELVSEALSKRDVRKWAEENGLKIKPMPPFPVAGIEVYPEQEMANPDGKAANEPFKRDDRLKAKFPMMYTLTPVE